MPKYINKKTNVLIETDCRLLGDWVLASTVSQGQKEHESKVEIVEEVVIPEELPVNLNIDQEQYDGVTVKQIKQELDALGIEYDKRATKSELYSLMQQGG